MANARAVIDIDINTSPAAAGLRNLQSQINGFTTALNKANTEQGLAAKGITRQLSDLVNASKFFTAETVRMQTSAAQLDNTLKKGQVTMGQFFSARFRKDGLAAAQVMSLANARASALQTQFIQTGAAANGMRDALAIRPLQAFNSQAVVSAQKLAIHRAMLQQATTSMINFGKNTQWAGRQLMVGFTVPLTIFAGVAGKAFRDLEKEAVNFKKVYGDSFTPPEEMEANLKAVQELAKEYTKYGIAVKDTVSLAAQAAAAGAQNADLIDATRQATRLATLGQMEQNQALETTISLQSAFKLSGDELAKSINFLNMVENQTVVTLQDLSAAIPRVAPVIKGLGGSVEDLAVMLAALQEGGVTAEQGANALKSGLASLINPTDKAVEKLQGMGIALNTIVEANRGDLMGTVQDFSRALSTLDTFTRQQALETVFGKFQYARLGALFDNIIKDGSQASRVLEITTMNTAEMAASAEKELGAIEQSVGTKFTAAMEKLQLAIAPIGEMFTKMAIPVINFFVKIIEKFNELPDFTKNFIGLATVIGGIVIPAGTMFLGLLMNLIGTLVKFGSIVGTAFKGFTSGGFKGALDAVSQSVRYMSLQEIDASLAAQQLRGSTEAVNAALLEQVGTSEAATAGIAGLAGAYEVLIANMREAVAVGGLPMVVPGAAMRTAGRGGASNLVGRPLPIVARNKGGSIPYFSKGGRPTVPGVGNTDTVPAMLTPGEFVVNKKSTQENIGLLNAINNGDVQYRSLGGPILSFAAQQARGRLSQFESSRSAISNIFGLPVSGVGRSSAALSQMSVQAERSSRRSMSQKVWDEISARVSSKGQKLKSVRLAEYLMNLEKNPLTIEELGLKAVGNYVLDMSQASNIAAQMRMLTRQDLLSEIRNKSAVYRPLDEQLRSYFGTPLDYNLFDDIYRARIASLPKSGIDNRQFEKASRLALGDYLDKAGYSPAQRNAFRKDILAKDLVRANVSRERIERLLQENNIPVTRSGRDMYIQINGESFNVGSLSGKKFGTLRTSEERGGIKLYESLTKRSGSRFARVHANKGGLIPGGIVNSGRNFYGRFNAKTVEMFTKWISAMPNQTAQMKAAVGKDAMVAQAFRGGFRRSKAAETLQRSTWMTKIPKPGSTMSLGALASFSPTDTDVIRHLANSKIRSDYESAGMQLGMSQKNLKKLGYNLKRIRDIGPENLPSWAPERSYVSPFDRKSGLDVYMRDSERFITGYKADVKNQKAQMREYFKYTPTIIELQTPRGTIRANLDDIVALENQKFMGKQATERERILHNPLIKVMSIEDEAQGIKRIKAKLLSSEYPGFNKGGMIPGVQYLNRAGLVASRTLQDFLAPRVATQAADVQSTIFARNRHSSPGFLQSLDVGNNPNWVTFAGNYEKGFQGTAPKTVGQAKNLFGPGTYTTRDEVVAASYLKKQSDAQDDQERFLYKTYLDKETQARKFLNLDDAYNPAANAKLNEVMEKFFQNIKNDFGFDMKTRSGMTRRSSDDMTRIGQKRNDLINEITSRSIGKTPAGKRIKKIEKEIERLEKIDDKRNIKDFDRWNSSKEREDLWKRVELLRKEAADLDLDSRWKAEMAWQRAVTDSGLWGLQHQGGLRAGKGQHLHEVMIWYKTPDMVQYRNNGGFISPTLKANKGNIVPGVGNTDTVPAMLTPGEFVINKQATMDNLGLLHAINSGQMKGYQEGGVVSGAGQMTGDGKVWYVQDERGNIKEFNNQKSAERYSKQVKKAVAKTQMKNARPGGGMMRGMGASMGLGMGGMGIMMVGQQMQASAAQSGETSAMGGFLSNAGIAMSVASVLPFMGKFGIAIAAATAVIAPLALALKTWRESVDEASRKAADLGANIGGASNALNTMASVLGETTPAQRQAQLQMGFGEDQQNQFVAEFAAVFETESGKKFIEDLENATSSERFLKLSSYLQNAIAAGMMDKAQAQNFAKAVSSMISDPTLGAKTATSIREQDTGADALAELARQREQDVSISSALVSAKTQETISYKQSSQVLGSSLQVIQAYANAQALAYEEFASGSINFEEYQKIVQESRDAQAEYTQAVQLAMQKTSDFGGSMQALKSEIAKIIGEEKAGEVQAGLEDAAARKANLAVYGKEDVSWFETFLLSVGSSRGGAQYSPEAQQKQLATQDVNEIIPVVAAAIFGGMNENVATEIGAQIISGQGGVAKTYRELEGDLGARTAFETATLVNQVKSGELIGGIGATGIEERRAGVIEGQRERAVQIVTDFVTQGGDPVAFQAWINSIPEEKQFTVLTKFEGMSAEEEQRYIADAGSLAQAYGDVFAQNLQDSQQYQDALAGGNTEQILDSVLKAKEAGVEEVAINYAISATENGKPADLTEKIDDITQATIDISSLPEEIIKGLGIDIKNIQDLERFGPMVDQFKKQWSIIKNLDPNIDMVASMKFLTLDNDGNPLPPNQVAQNVITLNNAWNNLSSKNPEVRLQALIDIATAYAGDVPEGMDPTEVAMNVINKLREQFKDFDKLDPIVASQMIQVAMQGEVVNAGLIAEQVALREELAAIAAKDELAPGDAQRALRIGDRLEEINGKISENKQQTEATLKAMKSTATKNTPRGSGGGQKEKSIPEQLRESSELAIGFSKIFDKKNIGQYLSKPFGPEFLQYLKSQGQKGLDLLNGNLKKVKSAYEDFRNEQKAESLMVLKFMPAQLAQDLKGRKDRLSLVKKIAQQEGMSLQTAMQAVDVLDSAQQSEYLSLLSKKKLTKEEKNRLKTLNRILEISKESALWDEEHAEIIRFMNMSAKDREAERISNAQQILSIERQIDEINKIEPLQKQLDAQQRIIDSTQRTIDLKQREIDSIDRTIELEERKIEPIDKAIEQYEKQIDVIEENYKAQLDALDMVAEKEEDNAKLRKSRLDLASAISRGDVASAASIAMQIRNEQAASQRGKTRAALEKSRELEIEEVQGRIKEKEQEREAIQERINSLQLDQRKIQDDIYTLQTNTIPVQDEIYRIQGLITKETDALNSKYDDTRLRIQALRLELDAALATQNAINKAAAEENRVRRQKAEAVASYEPGSYVGATQSASVAAQFPTQVLANASRLNAAAAAGEDLTKLGFTKADWQALAQLEAANKAAGLMYGGQIKKYAMGGMVSYKGSTEKAPGFMMGGQIKKYAFGSYVPGTGMTDKVPAMLTPGEFVVRKSVAQQMLPQLKNMNSQIYPGMSGSMNYGNPKIDRPGSIRDYLPRFDIPVIPAINSSPNNFSVSVENNMPPINNVQYTYNINVSAETNASPDDIANTVIRKIRLQDKSNVRSYNFRG